MNRIDALFEQKRREGGRSLILYVTAGYPDLDFTREIVPKLCEWGCDLIELGIPFSDPIADGPTIQAASAVALEKGTTVRKILALLSEVRQKTDKPIILFSALNPLLKYGLKEIVSDAKAAGADGFLVSDLIPEEGEQMEQLCREQEMALVYLVAPTSTPERKKMIAGKSTGFVYYITVRGVTGARQQLPEDLERQISEISESNDRPVAVGFGISRPEHVSEAAQCAEGIVIGSALINEIREAQDKDDPLAELEKYVRPLAEACKKKEAAT